MIIIRALCLIVLVAVIALLMISIVGQHPLLHPILFNWWLGIGLFMLALVVVGSSSPRGIEK